MSTTSVLLADDHVVVRKGFRMLLDGHADLQVVGEAGSSARKSRMLSLRITANTSPTRSTCCPPGNGKSFS